MLASVGLSCGFINTDEYSWISWVMGEVCCGLGDVGKGVGSLLHFVDRHRPLLTVGSSGSGCDLDSIILSCISRLGWLDFGGPGEDIWALSVSGDTELSHSTMEAARDGENFEPSFCVSHCLLLLGTFSGNVVNCCS